MVDRLGNNKVIILVNLLMILLSFVLQVDCCIVYINSSTKKVGLSLHKSIVEGKAHEFGLYGIGDIIDGATVTRVDQGLGLLMNLSEDVKGYAHVRDIPV